MSLIPSESENFPDSFRLNVGLQTSQQSEDPKAVAAVQRLGPTSDPVVAQAASEPTPEHQRDLAPQPNSAATEDKAPLSSQPEAAVEDQMDATAAPVGTLETEVPTEPLAP